MIPLAVAIFVLFVSATAFSVVPVGNADSPVFLLQVIYISYFMVLRTISSSVVSSNHAGKSVKEVCVCLFSFVPSRT